MVRCCVAYWVPSVVAIPDTQTTIVEDLRAMVLPSVARALYDCASSCSTSTLQRQNCRLGFALVIYAACEHSNVSTQRLLHAVTRIHGYLSSEVGQLLGLYLWLILPFAQAINRLAFGDDSPPLSFLYAEEQGSWDNIRLSTMLPRTF